MAALRTGILGALVLMAALPAFAQEGGIAPLPDASMQRITPTDHNDADILSTKPVKKAEPAPAAAPAANEGLSALPWQAAPAQPAAQPAAAPKSPFGSTHPAGAATPNSYLPAKVPFGHAERPLGGGAEVPSGPHDAIAVPVGNVDAVEVSEPAPPTPPEAGADPVKEDASTPTEFTSPIFEGAEDSGAPRRIVFRALNKVTAQSMLFKAKPNETVRFGKLEINAVMCRNSASTSQADSAALLDIRETLPGKEGGIKPLFRGWMYASSPSITALEHPIYDVTMVDCELIAAPKPEPKEDKKSDKSVTSKKKK